MRRTTLLSALAAAWILAGCGADDVAPAPTPPPATTGMASASPAVSAETVTVDVRGFTYKPQVIEVEAGTTITWINADQILHTVTSGTSDNPDGLIDGQMTEAGASISHTFDTPGTVTYFCSRHQFMQGEVIVR